METVRKPFEGVFNIVRFNWHYYAISLFFVMMLCLIGFHTSGIIRTFIVITILGTLVTTLSSLLASYYVYDCSPLYRFDWLRAYQGRPIKRIANIHAGFDETSALIQKHFPDSELQVFDFYNPKKHTEISIERARRCYAPFPNTQTIDTHSLPVPDKTIDLFLLILAAHEIRDDEERISFFQELKRGLAPMGQIIVIEHLRDLSNFLAYSIGFFHFHSKSKWLKTFSEAGLTIAETKNITPFITHYTLTHGTAS